MIYLKAKLNDDVEMKIDLYGDEFRFSCPKCTRECDINIEEVADIVKNGGDLAGTVVYCEQCSSDEQKSHSRTGQLLEGTFGENKQRRDLNE